MKYDLEERTAKFGENVIVLVKVIKRDDVTRTLVNQIVRSATSVGANYMEANQASSKRDFRNKIKICAKEANETKHWLRMLAQADESNKGAYKRLWKEAHELTLIFARIVKTTDNKN